MELRCDVASFEIENQRNSTGVAITRSEVHRTLGTRLPSWDLLASRDAAVENVNRTTPYMQISKLGLRPAGPGEDVDRRETVLD
jgi:hypothetical protein